MDLGARIKELRESAGLTQVQCARRSGFTRQRWWSLENSDGRSPRLLTVHRVAVQGLGVTIAWLVDPENAIPPQEQAGRHQGNLT